MEKVTFLFPECLQESLPANYEPALTLCLFENCKEFILYSKTPFSLDIDWHDRIVETFSKYYKTNADVLYVPEKFFPYFRDFERQNTFSIPIAYEGDTGFRVFRNSGTKFPETFINAYHGTKYYLA